MIFLFSSKTGTAAKGNRQLNASESVWSSSAKSIESTNSSESDNNIGNLQETTDASQQCRITTLPKMPMHEILNIIKNGNINALLENKYLHYFFLKHCVINVISRKRWKDNNTKIVIGFLQKQTWVEAFPSGQTYSSKCPQ